MPNWSCPLSLSSLDESENCRDKGDDGVTGDIDREDE